MKLVYVSGPYRAPTIRGVVENIRVAENITIELWKLGFAVICPHKNTAMLDGIIPGEKWIEGDIEMITRCDLVVMVPGWECSVGARAEREAAKEKGIEVVEWDNDHRSFVGFYTQYKLRKMSKIDKNK